MEEDTAFMLMVCKGDPVAFETLCKMSSRNVLSICESYLRKVSFDIKAMKHAQRKRNG